MTHHGRPADDPGTVYLLHLDPPLKHARHYTGWTSNLDARLEAHRSGRGARLMEVIKEAGGTFRLARTWPGSRTLERAIKDRHQAPRLCPECSPQPQPVSKGRGAAAVSRPAAAPHSEAEFVPEPDPEAWLRPFPGRPAGPEVYDDLLPLTERLTAGWRAQLDAASPAPEPEPDLELELLARPPAPFSPAGSNQPEGTAHGHPEKQPESRR